MRQRSTCSNIYDKAERESISLKEIEELLRKNGLSNIDIVIIFCQKYLFFQLLL